MTPTTNRLTDYSKISSALTCMSNQQIKQKIIEATPLHTGIGGSSAKTEIDGRPVFIKKVPVSSLELQANNYLSTANIFNLPTAYQYGIGSTGFGVWRELASHQMTTHWVMSQKHSNFPMLYHSRLLKNWESDFDDTEEKREKDCLYWENNPNIRSRLEERAQATHHLCFFLEFIPYQLAHWLMQQLNKNEDIAISAVNLVEKQLRQSNQFMLSEKFLHMDTHFSNILTDGQNIYFTDFGLALSNQFELSKKELNFFNENGTYDLSNGVTNLLYCLIRSRHKMPEKNNLVQGIRGDKVTFKSDSHQFKEILYRYMSDSLGAEKSELDKIIKHYAPIAIKMNEFYIAIQTDKSKKYPNAEMELLWKSRAQVR